MPLIFRSPRKIRKVSSICVGILLGLYSSYALSEPLNSLSTSGDQELIIESDMQTTDSENGTLNAFGNVKILYLKRGIVATSDHAKYQKLDGVVTLTGNVDFVRDGSDSFQSQRVVYSIDEDMFVADSPPGSQVILRFNVDPESLSPRPFLK